MYSNYGTPQTSVPPPRSSYTDPGPGYGQGYQQSGYSSYGNYRKPFTYSNHRQNPRDRRSDPGGHMGGVGGNRGYSGGGYNFNPTSGENYYGRTNNRGRINGVSYGRGRGGRQQESARQQGKFNGSRSLSADGFRKPRRDSGSAGGDFYGRRDYTQDGSSGQKQTRKPFPQRRYQSNNNRIRGRGSSAGGRGRGGRGGRGMGFRPRPQFTNYEHDFKCAFEMKNVPDGIAMKELRDVLKDREISSQLNIVHIKDSKALVKATEKFEEVKKKLEGLQIEDKHIEVTEVELKANKPRSSLPAYVKLIFASPTALPSKKTVEASLKTLDLGSPLSFKVRHEEGMLTFKLVNCGPTKEVKAKLKSMKIKNGEVTKAFTTSKPGSIIVKVQPPSGHLKVENIPEDCDAKKLRQKLKQKLSYEIEVKPIENGKADVVYKPKNMVILEKLSGLTIEEHELGIKEVEVCDETSDEVVGVPFPKAFSIKQLGKFLGDLIPTEIFLKEDSFSLNFNAESKVLRKIQDKVSNFKNTKSKAKKKPNRGSWAEEKEKEDEENNKTSEINQNEEPKIDAPVMFGSTDIRERRKSVGDGDS